MRALERFLILLALISLLMRGFRMKDGPTMELIALPLLATFCLIATPFFLRQSAAAAARRSARWILTGAHLLCGAALAYALISLMLYTLGWLPGPDMAVNSGLLILLILLFAGLRYRKTVHREYAWLLVRAGILAAVIAVSYFITFNP